MHNYIDIRLLNTSNKSRCCGVVVITLVLHTKGPQFDPGQQQKACCLSFLASYFIWAHLTIWQLAH